MLCPFATSKPIQGNHGGQMSGHIGLVLHVAQGNGSLFGWFSNPSAQVSAHFWVSKTGQLEQYVDTDLTAWAEMAGNANYLSVETEGYDTEALTAQQVATVGRLLGWAAGTFKFPLRGPVPHGLPGLTLHSNPDGTPDPAWGNHPCPGAIRLAQVPAILASAGVVVPPQPPPPQPQPSKEDLMNIIYADGQFVCVGRSAAGHPYVFYSAHPVGPWGVCDVTDEILKRYPKDPPFTVAA